jgi:hypothetical protein
MRESNQTSFDIFVALLTEAQCCGVAAADRAAIVRADWLV